MNEMNAVVEWIMNTVTHVSLNRKSMRQHYLDDICKWLQVENEILHFKVCVLYSKRDDLLSCLLGKPQFNLCPHVQIECRCSEFRFLATGSAPTKLRMQHDCSTTPEEHSWHPVICSASLNCLCLHCIQHVIDSLLLYFSSRIHPAAPST